MREGVKEGEREMDAREGEGERGAWVKVREGRRGISDVRVWGRL